MNNDFQGLVHETKQTIIILFEHNSEKEIIELHMDNIYC